MTKEASVQSRGVRPVGVELHVPDFERAREFYFRLGFALVRSEPRYMVLAAGQSVIMFYGGDAAVASHSYFQRFDGSAPRGYGVELCLFVDDLDRIYRSFADDPAVVAPLTLRPWGKRDFRLADPFGYYLRITEDYDPCAAPPPAGRSSIG